MYACMYVSMYIYMSMYTCACKGTYGGDRHHILSRTLQEVVEYHAWQVLQYDPKYVCIYVCDVCMYAMYMCLCT